MPRAAFELDGVNVPRFHSEPAPGCKRIGWPPSRPARMRLPSGGWRTCTPSTVGLNLAVAGNPSFHLTSTSSPPRARSPVTSRWLRAFRRAGRNCSSPASLWISISAIAAVPPPAEGLIRPRDARRFIQRRVVARLPPSAPGKTDPALLAKNDPETWGSGGGRSGRILKKLGPPPGDLNRGEPSATAWLMVAGDTPEPCTAQKGGQSLDLAVARDSLE